MEPIQEEDGRHRDRPADGSSPEAREKYLKACLEVIRLVIQDYEHAVWWWTREAANRKKYCDQGSTDQIVQALAQRFPRVE